MSRSMICLVVGIVLLAGKAYANSAPVVSNVQAHQQPGTMVVDITYDVFDADADALSISVQISDDGGQTWRVPAKTFRGEVGPRQASGAGKHLEWDAGVDVPNIYGVRFVPKVIADDGQGTSISGGVLSVPLSGGLLPDTN